MKMIIIIILIVNNNNINNNYLNKKNDKVGNIGTDISANIHVIISIQFKL